LVNCIFIEDILRHTIKNNIQNKFNLQINFNQNKHFLTTITINNVKDKKLPFHKSEEKLINLLKDNYKHLIIITNFHFKFFSMQTFMDIAKKYVCNINKDHLVILMNQTTCNESKLLMLLFKISLTEEINQLSNININKFIDINHTK
jgi:hypothetical protein